MKTRKHGSGMSHFEVVRFSNRMARPFVLSSRALTDFEDGFERGWNSACKYFTHELRLKLRDIELSTLND